MKKEQATKKTEKGYSTKYALTQGVAEVVIDLEYSSDDKYAYTKPVSANDLRQQLIRGKTYFANLDDAIVAAKKMAERKVKSLKMELARMERLAVGPQLAFEQKRG